MYEADTSTSSHVKSPLKLGKLLYSGSRMNKVYKELSRARLGATRKIGEPYRHGQAPKVKRTKTSRNRIATPQCNVSHVLVKILQSTHPSHAKKNKRKKEKTPNDAFFLFWFFFLVLGGAAGQSLDVDWPG